MDMTRAEFDALYAAGPDALSALFQQQAAQLAALTARVQRVEGRLGGHSQNSHRPPSSDGPRKPRRGQRSRSGKAPGGQPGHTLAMVATPDQVVARRQVVDLPPLALAVTEYQAATVCCPHCQRPTAAPFPAPVARPVQYGPRVLGLGVYLRHYQLLPYHRIRALLADLFGAHPSVGTLHTASLTCAAALGAVEAAVAAALSAAPLLHGDETSVNVAGQRQLVYVANTVTLTHYAWHAKRRHAATDRVPPGCGILPRFAGRLIHDGWASYWHYGCRHGLCNAHYLRELAAVAEHAGQD